MSREMKDSGVEWIGEIPENWGVTRLKYAYDNSNGSAVRVGPLEVRCHHPIIFQMVSGYIINAQY